MFTKVATSKLLGCPTLVTKPLRAPKPLSRVPDRGPSRAVNPARVQGRRSDRPGEEGAARRSKCAGVYARALPQKNLGSHRYACDARGFVCNQRGVE